MISKKERNQYLILLLVTNILIPIIVFVFQMIMFFIFPPFMSEPGLEVVSYLISTAYWALIVATAISLLGFIAQYYMLAFKRNSVKDDEKTMRNWIFIGIILSIDLLGFILLITPWII